MDYEQVLAALHNKVALPQMPKALLSPLSPVTVLTSTNVQERQVLLNQINTRIAHNCFGRDLSMQIHGRCVQALTAVPPLEAVPRSTVQSLMHSCLVLTEARNVLNRCLITEFYVPYMTCKVVLTTDTLNRNSDGDGHGDGDGDGGSSGGGDGKDRDGRVLDDAKSTGGSDAPSALSAFASLSASSSSTVITGAAAVSLFVFMTHDIEKQTQAVQALVERLSRSIESNGTCCMLPHG